MCCCVVAVLLWLSNVGPGHISLCHAVSSLIVAPACTQGVLRRAIREVPAVPCVLAGSSNNANIIYRVSQHPVFPAYRQSLQQNLLIRTSGLMGHEVTAAAVINWIGCCKLHDHVYCLQPLPTTIAYNQQVFSDTAQWVLFFSCWYLSLLSSRAGGDATEQQQCHSVAPLYTTWQLSSEHSPTGYLSGTRYLSVVSLSLSWQLTDCRSIGTLSHHSPLCIWPNTSVSTVQILPTRYLPAKPLLWGGFCRSWIFKTWREYFHYSYLLEAELDPTQHYIFAEFPHGVVPLSVIVAGECPCDSSCSLSIPLLGWLPTDLVLLLHSSLTCCQTATATVDCNGSDTGVLATPRHSSKAVCELLLLPAYCPGL